MERNAASTNTPRVPSPPPAFAAGSAVAPVAPVATATPRVLVVDDEPKLRTLFDRILRREGYAVDVVPDGASALNALKSAAYDAMLSDVTMPGMSGIALLRAARQIDPDLAIALLTGGPTVESAAEAVELGAVRYLLKPISPQALTAAVATGVEVTRAARQRRGQTPPRDLTAVAEQYRSALAGLWTAQQPLIRWSTRSVYAYESLVRTTEKSLGRPDLLFAAAEDLHELSSLGRAIRARIESALGDLPAGCELFLNLHADDLLDETLFDATRPLAAYSSRVVLEITERASLDRVPNLADRLARLRALGYRIAVDDLGAGFAGLTSLAQLRPEVVKIDMSLVRGVDGDPTRQKLVKAIVGLCADLGSTIVAEGVETRAERDTLIDLGCDVFQGYLFAKPSPGFCTAQNLDR